MKQTDENWGIKDKYKCKFTATTLIGSSRITFAIFEFVGVRFGS